MKKDNVLMEISTNEILFEKRGWFKLYNLLKIKKQNFYFSTISFGEVQPFTPSSSFVLNNFTKKRLNKWT